jgi:hypothetical protein
MTKIQVYRSLIAAAVIAAAWYFAILSQASDGGCWNPGKHCRPKASDTEVLALP